MLNRSAAPAEPDHLSRGLETKVTRRPWNPALHPRDSKGRFIETGGIARLWSGKLARVVRALPHDRVLVQDRSSDGTYTGRRHTTSARWITMVARPDGSAPTKSEDKVAAEDERRHKDSHRGNGVARDDDGDPSTPNDPHDVDDDGQPIGKDDGNGPHDDDDQDEPEHGQHPVKLDALPNQRARTGSRYADTAAVRRHFLELAEEPDTTPKMATYLRHMAHDEDLRITPSGGLVVRRDEANGRWYLTATGTGRSLEAGDFTTAQEAEDLGEYLNENVLNGHIAPGEFRKPFDFSDPDIDRWAAQWRSDRAEDPQRAIARAKREFAAAPRTKPAKKTTPAARRTRAASSGQRFTTLQQVRSHWGTLEESLEARQDAPRAQQDAKHLQDLMGSPRVKLAGNGQFVIRKNSLGGWELISTGDGMPMPWTFDRQGDAQDFANSFVGTVKGQDGKPLDLSAPDARQQTWRSDDDLTLHQVWTRARAEWDREHGHDRSPAQHRLDEVMRGSGKPQETTQPAEPETSPAPEPEAPAPTAPQTDTPAAPVDERQVPQPEPAGPSLPDDAQPVDGVDGYHYTNDGGAVTVYGPDAQVAVTSVRGYPPKATVNDVQFPVPQYPKSGAAVMARAHRAAQMPPGQRDAITAEWTTFKGKRVMVFRGTVKNDDRDYTAVGSVRAIKWAPSLDGWVTQSNMRPETRDERIAEVLGNLARQGRYVLVGDEDRKGEDAPKVPDTSPRPGTANAPDTPLDEEAKRLRAASDSNLQGQRQNLRMHVASARTDAQRRRDRASLARVEAEIQRREQEKRDASTAEQTPEETVRALSDRDLYDRIARGAEERGMYGSRRGDAPNEQERAEYVERRRRSRAIAEDSTDLTSLSDEDLAQARNATGQRITNHRGAGDDHEAEQDVRQALQTRHDAIVAEQEQRRAAAIASRPPVAELDDEQLDKEHTELIRREFRKAGPEAQRILEGRLEEIKNEQKERKKRSITDRPAPESVDSDTLAKEYGELTRGRTSYEDDEIAKARKTRMDTIADELDRRDTKDNEQLLARVDNPDSPSGISIDGGAPYGRVEYHAYGGTHRKEGWSFERSGLWGSANEGFSSRAAALAALVRSYDSDDNRRGERTWGRQHSVFVPKMFFELYGNRRRADGLASATAERRYLFEQFNTGSYGWSDGTNPLTGKSGKGRNLVLPEGLLAEFHRVTEELSREMMQEAHNRNRDSSDRSKAKSRLAAINAALHAIEAAREQVRKDGGNDNQKVISREEIEAQQAALRAALGGDDDEHVQPDGAGALGEAPSARVGGDGGPAGVRDGEGPGDRDGGSGGRGGAGADGEADGRISGSRGAAQAAQGGRDGDGAARSSTGTGAGDRGGAGAAQSGDGGADGDQGRDVRRVGVFRPDPADAPKGPKARAQANVEAIKVLKSLEAENREATDAEKRILARWSGWGSVPIIFATEPDEKAPLYQQGGARHGKFEQDHRRWDEYSDVRNALREVLSPLEFRQASRGTLSMHYTPQPIAEAMWDGLRAFGFERGDVLEAGSGAGTFFGVAPNGARLTGIELDPTTARIAQAIHPHANILNESFAETDAHPGTFDAAIGNVPFASIPFDDKRYPSESLHNGFITKELALVRPGGITTVITSRHTLDSKGNKARRQMAKYGDLIGAVRLPSGVFNEAGTGVTTDVLVFRRREDGQEPGDTSWLDAPERDINGTAERVNSYFTEHPEHILGELTTESSPYGPRLTVKGDPAKAADQLRDTLKEIAAKATADGRGYQPHPDGDDRSPVRLQAARERHANDWTGRLYEGDDGTFYQHVNGGDPVPVEPSDGRTEQLRALMGLRDVAAELRELDRKNDEDERAEKLRGQLRDLHAAYVAEYGPLSKPRQTRTMAGAAQGERVPTAWGYFRSDPDAAAVLALEQWDADKQEPVLSRVFSERAAARRQPLTSTDDPKAALAAVVAATGEVDLGAVSRLLNLNPQETLRRLGTEVFTDPGTGRLELAGAYLSGSVRDKLEAARKAAAKDPAYAVNVAALEAVQPPDRTIGEFTPEMGAHWTPPELLQGFLREYLGDRTLSVAHNDRYGWILNTGKVPEGNNVLHGVAPNAETGARGKSAVGIARAILGFGSLTIYRDDKRRDVDEATSRLVRQKADQMRADFAKYATANAERLTTLTDSFNRIMNGHVVRSYDGMSPTLEGFTPDRTPHPWQLAGAARMQFEPSVILAHEVGLGKTSTLVMGTQALKASGQVEKPFAVVPDHLAQQWYDEARFLYPNADIHLITSADLADGQRNSTLEWLRANKPDLVIFTEPAFGSIKMSPEAQEVYQFRELEALREQLDRQYADADNPQHPFIVAKIEQRIATVERNLNKNAAPMRKPGETYWDDLGYDYAVIDEAHRYKGVGFRSKEGGGDPASIRGIDLHQKLTDLHRRRDGRATLTLATGTPLSNSISEQFTMLSFAAPWILDDYKAGAPDLWANTFGRKVLRIENAPDGSGLRVVERFAEFRNKRAMKTMWGLVADTKRAEDVGIPRPKLKGNAPNLVMVDPTKDQTARLKRLVARGRAIHNGEVDRHQDNMLAVSNEGTSVALDPRLVDANAPAGNKLRAVADAHAERYHRYKDRVYKTYYGSTEDHPTPGAFQMLFLNEGVPGGNNKGNFDAYAELKRLMVKGGIPEEKIAFVQDHKKSGKPEELAELFRRARDGDIAVLIGSSSVAGTGMNAQNRMVSLTHVDLDWGAAQMEQRNGRILRYGNQNPEVEINIFATKGSMDGWKAGFVAAKAEGLIDIQRPDTTDGDTSDTVTEIDGAEFDYETMEAEIGGNPFMSQLMKARRALRDLEIDQHNEAAERIRRAEALAALRQEADDTRAGIARREQALPRIRDVRDTFAMNLGGASYGERAEAAAALHRQITTRLLEHDREGMTPWHVLGQFGGLDFGVRTERTSDGKLVAHVGFPDLARSEFTRTPEDLKKKNAGSGMLTRLANALEKAPALQEADRKNVPHLDEQIALLQSAHAAADFTPQIDHARTRANLLEDVVGKVADLDKLPEIDPDELPKKHTPAQRRAAVSEREKEREPLKARIDEAVANLEEFDRDNPAPEQPERVRLTEEEVNDTLARIRPDDGSATDTTRDVPETESPNADGGHDGGDGTPPPAVPTADGQDEGTGEQQIPTAPEAVDEPSRLDADAPNPPEDEASADDTPSADAEPDTVTLDQDEVAAQLDAIRPEGVKAPSAMSDMEIAEEIVALMEREMTDGELSGVDRTRMAVLEAEKDRRAGRSPKPEPKPQPAEPEGGLFDLDESEPSAPAADPDNPLDRPDDQFGTPDMFADHEGRDTSNLRPVQMRNAADLEPGDRYTDADGHTHTVREKNQTGRGRIRVVTGDGRERFYTPDSELRLRYPDEDVPDNDEERNEPKPGLPDTPDVPADGQAAGSPDNSPDGPEAADGGDVADAPGEIDRTELRGRLDRMADYVGRALDVAGWGDSLPEIHDMADTMDRLETEGDPEEGLRDLAERLDALADRYEATGPRGKAAGKIFRRAARIARNEDDDASNEDAPHRPDNAPSTGEPTVDRPHGEDHGEGEDSRDGDDRRRQRDSDADGTDPDGASPDSGPDDGSGVPGSPTPDRDENQDGTQHADGRDDQESRRRRRRGRGGANGAGGAGGPGGPGGPGLPRLGLPLGSNRPSDGSDSGGRNRGGRNNSGTGDGADSDPRRSVDALRNAWRRGDGLTQGEDTPARRAFLNRLADNPTLALSPHGGIITWREEQEDGTAAWHFAQARNGARLPKVSLMTENPDEARELAGRFEEISDSAGQRFDWHRPWGPSTVAQWRDEHGRTLPTALRHVQDEYRQRHTASAGDHEANQPDAQAVTLPDDLTAMTDEDIASAWRQGLVEDDQMRVMAEMDRRDDADRRIRDAVPDTPPADAEEEARRGAVMDAALGFGDTDVTRPARRGYREGQLQQEFTLADEARFLSAEAATRGVFLNREGERAGVNPRELFSGGSMSQFGRWRRYASEELLEWFEGNGGRLTFNQFRESRRHDERSQRLQHEEEVRRRDREQTPELDIAAPAEGRDDEATDGDGNGRDDNSAAANPEDGGTAPGRSGNGEDQAAPADDGDGETGAGNSPDSAASDEASRIADRSSEDTTDLYREVEQAARDAWGDDAEQRLAPLATAWRQAEAASADGDNRKAARYLYRAHSDAQTLARRLGDEPDVQDARAALNAFSVAAHNKAVRTWMKPGRGERWVTYGDLQQGDIIRDPSTNTLNVVKTPPSRTDGRVETFLWQLDDQGGGTRDVPSEHLVLLNENAAATRKGRKIIDRYESYTAGADNNRQDGDRGNSTSSPDGTAAPAPGDAAEPQEGQNTAPSGEQVTPDRLNMGDQVRVAGRNTRGANVTREGTLLAAPKATTGRHNGETVPVWRLYVGEEGQQPRPGNSVTIPRDGHAERLSTVPSSTNHPEAATPSATTPHRRPEPEAIGGQPAHWAPIDGLVPGDMARIDGTTKRGRAVTRAGYVLDTPTRVSVTRRGRTEDMWRTSVGETPDGRTGERGVVYTPLNATVARAEAPATAAPGAPASGAQGAIVSGDLPDTIPTDTRGRGLFPGSNVTGSADREGTITGATDTTVSVRWADGDTDTNVAPTSLTIDTTTATRPQGWTRSGQRVRPGHIVTDENGALLGPVDEANGDRITITTADGTVTRNAADLRVAGEVRDDAPGDTPPITGLTDSPAADLDEGNVVVIDLDGTPATVQIISKNREGDRVTIEYADTTTGEIGTLDMDVAAVLQRAEGPDGAAPDLTPADAPDRDDELTVHGPAPRIDPVTGPTADPDLTPADRNAIDGHGSAPEDDPDAQQAAVRIGADLPVTPDQAAALAAQLRASADPSTTEGRAALRAADHLDQAADRTPPAGLDRPRPSNAAQLGEGDVVAMPDERRGDEIRTFRVIDVEDGPGGVRSLLLEDENQQWRRRVVHGAMPVWQLPEPPSDAPSTDDAPTLATRTPRDPNPAPTTIADQVVADHPRTVAARIIDEAIVGTQPPGDIHALREQIAQRLTPEALREARQAARREAKDALDAAGITGQDRARAQQALKQGRQDAHAQTVRAALRTINDLEPLSDETNEDLAQRAAGLLRLIPDRIGATGGDPEGDGAVTRAVTGHVDDAVAALLQQLQGAGLDAGDAAAIGRLLASHLDGSRQAAARRIAGRVAAAMPAGQRPGLLASITSLLARISRRLVELVKAASEKIAEKWRNSRERLARLRAFLGRIATRVRQWPESRRLARLHAALDLPSADGGSLSARVAHWASLMPEAGRFGQVSRRTTWWRPTTWGQLAAGRLPGRSDRMQWSPDRAADNGPGLVALRHLAALRAAGTDVDQDVTRRLAAALGDDFGDDPHATLRHADDYVAATERRLVNLQAARGSSTIRTWSGWCGCGYVAVTGGAGAGPGDEEGLQFADDPVEAQAGAVSFGARASLWRVQKAWAAETRVTWWCQPFQVRPSKWARPRACFISR
ncbi:hypothetical protein AB0H73_08145 [Streptomyces olivoreticuli]